MAPQGDPSAEQPNVPQQLVAQAAAAVAGNAEEPEASSSRTAHDPVPDIHVEEHEQDIDEAPPAYGETYGTIQSDQNGMGTKASVGDDGRVNIRIDQRSRRLSNLLVPALRSQLDLAEKEGPAPPPYIPESLGGRPDQLPPPPLNVVIHVVGSRGDVQPFVALGKVLKEEYGHRVRLATHPVFKDFVTENGLEFFSIGGDPAELMAFMVKNPGLMPGFDTLRSGDVGKRRNEISEMIKGCWRSCIEAGDGTGIEASDNTTEDWMSAQPVEGPTSIDPTAKPFIADAIIANPPSFAHVHCAEKLGCPLHIMFTMPYSPTQAFPHPLANIQSSNADPHIANFMSYTLVDMMTWQGLGDVINRFRVHRLMLEPISLMWAPGMLARLRVPHTYCWSPALIPKPKDWGNHINISGFYFLSLASNYTPPPDLKEFLDAGPPPVYIGFGSIVVDDPNAMTKMIFDAVRKTGQRAIVSKGWGGLGADQLGIPDGVYMIGNCPHDWLFKQVSCVVHHGGAGTTAAGIALGKPTVIVPFFGDQPFWGAMVAKAGAGPKPIAYKDLTADSLAESILTALKPESQERAKELASKISEEKGSESGAQSFHQFLELDNLRCSLSPTRAAVWRLKRTEVRLSALAATTLGNEGLLDFKDLKLYRPREYETGDGPWDPITGGASAIIGTISSMMMGVADFPVETLKALRVHPDAAKQAKRESSPAPQGPQSGDRTPTERLSMSSDQGVMSSGASTVSIDSDMEKSETPASSQFNLNESFAKINSPTSIRSPVEESRPEMKSPRGSSMRTALNEGFNNLHRRSSSRSQGGSRSRSVSRDLRNAHCGDPLETALGTGKGVSRIIGAGFKSPMDFTLGLAQGFHNAPKLYGDDTVRKKEQVTDFRSGVRAATKEFGYGMYDGITGLVTQPMAGAKKEGFAGFLKGFGKGIGGIALKPGAAIFGIPAYVSKGIYRELQALVGSSVQNYIIAARTAQGFEDWHNASAHERAEIIRVWKEIQKDLKKKKTPGEHIHEAIVEKRKQLEEEIRQAHEKHHTRRGSSGQIFRHTSDFHSPEMGGRATPGSQSPGASTPIPAPHQLHHAQTYPRLNDADDTQLEEAIRLSVEQTSKGNPEEDDMIERAIRASIAELHRSPTTDASGQETDVTGHHPDDEHDEESEAIKRAMEASMVEAQRYAQETGGEGANDEELERAIKESMVAKRGSADDEDVGPALRGDGAEKEEVDDAHAEELRKAMEESERSNRDDEKGRSEEEIVLEYVKKQSLLEEEHRKAMLGKGTASAATTEAKPEGEAAGHGDTDDEELTRAMEMSMQKEE